MHQRRGEAVLESMEKVDAPVLDRIPPVAKVEGPGRLGLLELRRGDIQRGRAITGSRQSLHEVIQVGSEYPAVLAASGAGDVGGLGVYFCCG